MSIGRVPGATGIQPSIVDAKGDLIVATAADSVDRLAVGSNNQTLLADSAQTTGVKWGSSPQSLMTATGDLLYASSANTPARLAIGSTDQVLKVSGGVPVWGAAAGGGKVLQVVQGTYATSTSNSTGTAADTGLSASITPSATSSKVLVIASQNGCRKSDGNAANGLVLALLRDSTTLITFAGSLLYAPTLQHQMNGANSVAYLDSPSTTSSITYKTRFHNIAGSAASVTVQANNETSTIILLEIGA